MTAVTAANSEALLRQGSENLRRCGIPSARREARLLLAHALQLTADQPATVPLTLDSAKAKHFDDLIARRSRHEPLAYIVGAREFWSMDFRVTPGVLIPRPESETLVEAALRRNGDHALRVLDLGTGSGCLLLAFLSERPQASGVGVDLSETALAVAAANAKALGFGDRAVFQHSDWTANIAECFDVIFVNPPYVATRDIAGLSEDIAQFEPIEALDGGPDGLEAYRRLAPALPAVIAAGARVFVEIGHGQENQVPAIFEAEGFVHEGTACDLAGIPVA